MIYFNTLDNFLINIRNTSQCHCSYFIKKAGNFAILRELKQRKITPEFLTSDFEDSFSSICFNLSGGKAWSISAPSIAIGILTSEVKLNKVCKKSLKLFI